MNAQEVHMKPQWIIRILMLTALLLMAAAVVMGQTANKSQKAEINAADRTTINNYYNHLMGDLAPASLDRKGFSPEIERTLKPGNKLPLQLQKQLARLPRELETKLTLSPPGYEYYKLGRHILLIQSSDLMIGDIVRDAGWK
jgi:hypothetical protein